MTFDEAIKYCDGLPFLKRVVSPFGEPTLSFSGYQDVVAVSNPDTVIFEFVPAEDFNMVFHRGVLPCLLPNNKNQDSLWYLYHPPTFEEVFEKLSDIGKENIIYHLDFFKRRFD